MSRVFCLQDWVTIRGGTTSSSIAVTQDEDRWLDLSGFADAACWIDVAEVTPPGGDSNSLLLSLETAAVCDETHFVPIAPATNFGTATATQFGSASATPVLVRSIRTPSTSNVMRYLRWKITPSAAGVWDLTFRIRVVASRSSTFVPTQVAGCNLWLRSDLGISLSGASVSAWKDQSGLGNDATSVSAPSYKAARSNGLPKLSVASGNYLTGTLSNPISAHTLFCVLGYQSPLGKYSALAGTNSSHGVNSGFSQFTETTTGIIGRAGASGSSFTTAATTDASSLGSVGIYSAAASSGTAVDIWVNGVQKTSVLTALTLFACPSYLLFTLAVPTQYLFVGDAYEFILYDSVLSDADRRRVHRYLGARYGIAVP